MKLDGAHHVTMITGDAQRIIDFYAELLGLRLVKMTVNVDAPQAYHLSFGDETGAPGSLLSWFHVAGAPPGQAGDGMIHTVQLGVGAAAALDFWARRLRRAGHMTQRLDATLRLHDPDGLALELVVAAPANPPLPAVHPEVPAQHAIAGLQGARAYAPPPEAGDLFLTRGLGFTGLGGGEFRLLGEHRQFAWAYDQPPSAIGRPGAGTVHHIAWASRDDEYLDWRARAGEVAAGVTEVRDRGYFTSVCFREPRGVRFEISTLSPGFAVDEDPRHLGEQLRLPRRHEHLRAQLSRTLPPLTNPRARRLAVRA